MPGLEDFLLLKGVAEYEEQQRQEANPLFALAQGVSKGIEEGRAKMKAQKDEQDQFNRSLKMIDQFNATNSGKMGRVFPSISMKDNKISLGFETEKPISEKDQEMLRLREEAVKTNQQKEKRLLSANKLRAAQQLGGVLSKDELNAL